LLHSFSPDGHASLELNCATSKHQVEYVLHGIFLHVSFINLNVMLVDQLSEGKKFESIIVEVP